MPKIKIRGINGEYQEIDIGSGKVSKINPVEGTIQKNSGPSPYTKTGRQKLVQRQVDSYNTKQNIVNNYADTTNKLVQKRQEIIYNNGNFKIRQSDYIPSNQAPTQITGPEKWAVEAVGIPYKPVQMGTAYMLGRYGKGALQNWGRKVVLEDLFSSITPKISTQIGIPIGLKIKNTDSPTANLYKLINEVPKKGNYKFNINQVPQLDLLRRSGVDVSGITPEMLQKFGSIRKSLIQKTAPKEYGIHSPILGNRSQTIYLNKDGVSIGEIDLFYPKSFKELISLGSDPYLTAIKSINDRSSGVHVQMVKNLSNGKEHNLQEKLTNMAINLAKEQGYKGIVSGETLLQADKTIKMFPHYSSKKLISNNGEYHYLNGTSGKGPIYLLEKPSYQPPKLKSILFNPKTVDSRGVMNIDWNSGVYEKFGGKLNVYKENS